MYFVQNCLKGGSINSRMSFLRMQESPSGDVHKIPAYAGMTIFRNPLKLIIFIAIFFGVLNFCYSENSDSVSRNNRKPIFYIGGFAGYDINSHSSDFTQLKGYPNCCPQFAGGSGSGFSFGLIFDYPINDDILLNFRFGLHNLSGTLTKEQIIGNSEIRDAQPPYKTIDIVSAISNYSIKSSIQLIGIEPAIHYQFYQNFFAAGGLRLGFLSSATFDQDETLISPDNVVFKDTETRRRNEFTNQDIPEVKSMQFHILMGLGYNFNFAKNILVVPELRYYLAMTEISSVKWSVNQLMFSASVKFPFYKPIEITTIKEKQTIRDTSRIVIIGLEKEEVKLLSSKEDNFKENIDEYTVKELTVITEKYEMRIPKEPILTAAIATRGVYSDGTKRDDPTIIIEETETAETFPLLPHIFFAENSSILDNSNQKILTNNEIQSFNEDKLPFNTLEIYSQLLNIIGSRMIKFPDAKLVLTGTNNNIKDEKNNQTLSKARAESVKDYLINVWKIDGKRITTESRNLPKYSANNDFNEGIEENRRVELSSNEFEILKPVAIKDIVKTSNPPKLEIEPQINSEIAIKKWHVKVSQDGIKLREFSSKDGDILWNIEANPIPALEKPIDINLAAENVLGKTISVDKSLTLKQMTIKKKRFELKDDKRIERFALILFDYDKADLKSEHKIILEEIKSRILPNSFVTISGYTDRTGEYAHNKDLAAKRIENVLKILNLNQEQYEMINIGSDELLFDNNSPIGRSYCRTVKIVIETKISE
jgi:outer membrane protein OmpA-like peptidoglycan-associated protein